MNKKVSILNHIIFNILFMGLLYLYASITINNSRELDINTKITTIVSIIYAIYVMISYINLTRQYITPYLLFFASLYFFNFGQLIIDTFNIKVNQMSVINIYWEDIVFKGSIFSLICIVGFHIGGLIVVYYKTRNIDKLTEYNEYDINNKCKMSKLGKLILVIFIVPFLIVQYKAISLSLNYGYPYWIDINPMIAMLSNYLKPLIILAVLMQIIAFKEDHIKQNIWVIVLTLIGGIDLFLGSRTDGIAILLVIIWLKIFVYGKNKISIKFILYLSIIVILISYFNNIRTLEIDSKFGVEFNIDLLQMVFDTIAEFGLSIRPLFIIISSIPFSMQYKYGKTIVDSILTIVPNFLIDPIYTLDVNLASTVTEIAGTSYGLGFSILGEFYWNFGWFSGLAIIIFGIIIGSIFTYIDRDKIQNNSKMIFIMSMLLFIIFTLPRRGFYECVNKLFYFIVIPIILLKFVKIGNKEKNINN